MSNVVLGSYGNSRPQRSFTRHRPADETIVSRSELVDSAGMHLHFVCIEVAALKSEVKVAVKNIVNI